MARSPTPGPLSHHLLGWHPFSGSSWILLLNSKSGERHPENGPFLPLIGERKLLLSIRKERQSLQSRIKQQYPSWDTNRCDDDFNRAGSGSGRKPRSADLFATTLRQRCLVHKQRNVLSALAKREQQEVITELKGIWQQEKKEEALLNLAAENRQVSEALSRSCS
jgi:hypothetical protein